MIELSHALPAGYVLTTGQHQYRIERVLGAGGFGITYQAVTTVKMGNFNAKVKVAIKEHFLSGDCERLPDTSRVVYSNPARQRVENSRKDFISEAQRLHKVGISHPNIVKVNEVFEANNTAYYVMEYLDGQSLRAYVKQRQALSDAEMMEIITPIIDAVKTLHAHHMTHLDIKPDNIMLTTDVDDNMRPVLIDFGLSKHYDKDGRPTSTINTLGCSDGYAPIEQYTGITTFSPTADFYALGATMAFCLTGQDPKKASELIGENLADTLPDGIAPTTRATIAAMTAPKPSSRCINISTEGSTPNVGTRHGASAATISIRPNNETIKIDKPNPTQPNDSLKAVWHSRNMATNIICVLTLMLTFLSFLLLC